MGKLTLVIAIVFPAAKVSGIVGGIFYSCSSLSSFVMSALARIPAAEQVAAVNSINAAVINVRFMTVFMGTAILCLITGAASFPMRSQPGAEVILAASVVYLLGCFGVIVLFNLRLKYRLASMADTAQAVAF